MPFRSKAQVRKFGELVKQGKMTEAEFQRWLHETPNIKRLPERLHPGKNHNRAKALIG